MCKDVLRLVSPRVPINEHERLLLGSVVVVSAEPEVLAVLRTTATSFAARLHLASSIGAARDPASLS